jgi:predicted metalloprotease
MHPMVGEQGRVRLWVILVVAVLGLAAIATRDLWGPEGETTPSGPEQPGLGEPDLTTYQGVKQFVRAGADRRGTLAAIWEDTLVPAGTPFNEPRFKGYNATKPPSDPCTKRTKDWVYKENAYYCSKNQTIYWDNKYWGDLYKKYGHVQTVLLFAHEWGHHISSLRGDRTVFSVQEELQADCFAGMYFRRAFHTLDLDLSSKKVRSAASEWFDRGDNPDESSPWFEAGLHGRAWQRTSVFSLGFSFNSLRLCERLQTFGSRDIRRVGPYPVAVVHGSDIETVDRGHIRVTSDRGEADVRYLEIEPGTSFTEARELYSRTVMKGDNSVSDVQLRPLSDSASSNWTDEWSVLFKQRYEGSQVLNGKPETFHGVVLLAVLKKGGMVVFDTRAAGPASGADEGAWQRLDNHLTELYFGTAWEFG